MKLRTALFSLCLVAALVVGGLMIANLLHEQGNVTVAVNHIYGDPLTAGELRLNQTYVLDDKMQWDLDYNVWGEIQTQTHYSRGGLPYHFDDTPDALYFYTVINFGLGASGGTEGVFRVYNYNPMDTYPMGPGEDVASRTPAGESRTEEVYLADYCDVYPITMDITNSWIAEDDEDLFQVLRDYLAVPVPCDHLVEVMITKDDTDVTRHYDMSTVSGGYDIDGRSYLALGRDYYFTIQVEQEGEPVDHPLTQKIHRLTVLKDGDSSITGIERVEPVYDLPAGTRLAALELRENGEDILMLLEQDGNLVFQSLNADFAVMERLDLGVIPESSWGYQLFQGEDYLCALDQGGSFYLLVKGESGYEVAFSGDYSQHLDLSEEDKWDYLRATPILDYEDGKLAVTFGNGTSQPGEFIYLVLMDETGCCYTGSFQPSLVQDGRMGFNWNYAARRKDGTSMGVQF